MTISRPVLLTTRNVSDENCRENQNTHFTVNTFFCAGGDRAVYEITWKNIVEPPWPQITIWPMRIAHSRLTDARSECVILISFPRQQWLRGRSSILRYTYIASLV